MNENEAAFEEEHVDKITEYMKKFAEELKVEPKKASKPWS